MCERALDYAPAVHGQGGCGSHAYDPPPRSRRALLAIGLVFREERREAGHREIARPPTEEDPVDDPVDEAVHAHGGETTAVDHVTGDRTGRLPDDRADV